MAKPTRFALYLEELQDPDRPLSIAHLYQLSDLSSRDLAALRAAWPAIETARRRQIMTLLNEISETSFEVDFQAVAQQLGLRDDDPAVRRAAVEALWEPQDPAFLDEFVRLLSDDDDAAVRAAAAGALGSFVLLDELEELPRQWAGRAQQALFAVVGEPDEPVEVVRRAVEALGYSSDPRMHAIITAAYASDEETMRASAVFAMGRSADKRWLSVILKELGSANPQMRYEAARAAGELEARRAAPSVIALTADPDPEVQEAAIWALGEIGGAAARRCLERLCEDEDERVAQAADEALEYLLMTGIGADLPLLSLDEDELEEDIEELPDDSAAEPDE